MESRQLRRAAERQTTKEARKHQNAPAAEPSSRAEINRENSKHSTGPRTAQGKAASSGNSFKHGIYSRHLVIRNEDPAELDALKADLRAEHQPANTTEEILVNEMAEQFWRIRRFRNRESCYLLLEDHEEAAYAELKVVPVIQRMMAAAERGFHKALSALRLLQKDRGFVPHFSENAEVGFVPQETQNTESRLLLPGNEADSIEFQGPQTVQFAQPNADLDRVEAERRANAS